LAALRVTFLPGSLWTGRRHPRVRRHPARESARPHSSAGGPLSYRSRHHSALVPHGVCLLCPAGGGRGVHDGRATGAVPQAALSGLLVATISGSALVAMIPFVPILRHRVDELAARCPQTSSFAGSRSFSFSLGPAPPPPGFATPPAGLGAPPAGAFGIILQLLGAVVPIAAGMAVATGVASLAGLIGAATRSEPS
jgi:hypothetical protein